MTYKKFSLAAVVAAALLCAPVMARSLDSPAYTEKIEPQVSTPDSVTSSEMSTKAQPAGMIIRFEPKMVHYAVLPPITQSMATFDAYSVEFAALTVPPALNLAGDRYRALNTT